MPGKKRNRELQLRAHNRRAILAPIVKKIETMGEQSAGMVSPQFGRTSPFVAACIYMT